MQRPLLMPWFLPLAVGLLAWGLSSLRDLKRRGDRFLMVLLSLAPLLMWILAQLIPSGSAP